MPELFEIISSILVLINWFFRIRDDPKVSKVLQSIWADPTGSEQKNWKKSSLPGQGHVYPLDSSSRSKRGPNNSQAPIWPPQILTPIQHANLELKEIHYNPRNVILEFKGVDSGETLWLQVQMLTHTVVQVYNRQQWDNSLSKVNRKDRGFKIGMALDFGEYIIAFLSLDLVFKPIWGRSREELPAQHIDVYQDYRGFLEQVTAWADQKLSSPRDGLAINAIRKACKVFGGVGVYTVLELFFRAGLSPFLSEAEVFGVPSRFARFCEAYYSHAAKGHECLWDFIYPFLRDRYFLAVKNEDRLAYAPWLFVYAKDRTWIPSRMKKLLVAYKARICELAEQDSIWVRDSSHHLYDVFEPTYIKTSLMKEKNLGHLIWGCDRWVSMGGQHWQDCPLDVYFRRHGIDFTTLSCSTFLEQISLPIKEDFLETSLFVDDRALKASWVETKLFLSSEMPIWTLLPSFPNNSRDVNDSVVDWQFDQIINVTPVTGPARTKELFEYIVKHTNSYAVGPLDYCGVARIIHGRPLICRNDPTSRPRDVKRLEQNFARRSKVKPGSRKIATSKQSLKRKAERMPVLGSSTIQNVPTRDEEESGSQRPMKRQRLSSDKKLLLGIL